MESGEPEYGKIGGMREPWAEERQAAIADAKRELARLEYVSWHFLREDVQVVMPTQDIVALARYAREVEEALRVLVCGEHHRVTPNAVIVDETEPEKLRRRVVRVPAEAFLPRRPPRLTKGQEFTHPGTGARWRVTDVGSRTFAAINLSEPSVVADPSWANGPPYAIVEHVWDETTFGLLRDVPEVEWDE